MPNKSYHWTQAAIARFARSFCNSKLSLPRGRVNSAVGLVPLPMNNYPRQPEPTDQFTGLIKFALDHGVELIRKNGVLVPFMISVAQGDLTISAFPLEPGAAVESAKDSVRRLPPEADAYAIVFIGNIRLSGTPYNAVVVEASERGQSQGFRIGQPFEPVDSSLKIRLVGDAINLGLCEQLMA